MQECPYKISWGEFFDRFTIVIRKACFDSDYIEKKNEMINLLSQFTFDGKIWYFVLQLLMFNTDIWNLESDIRKGKEGHLGFEETGRRAIAIREKNQNRINIINLINEHLGDKFKEKKFSHVSENTDE